MTNENLMLRQALWVFLRPLIQLITNLISPEVGEEWLTEFKKFLRKEPCWVMEKAVTAVNHILSAAKSFMIAATAAKKTADCFTDKERYYYRDAAVDNLLPEVQQAEPGGGVTANDLTRNGKLLEMVQDLLGTSETELAVLSRLAIEAKQIFTLVQIERLIECQENGKDTGLLTNGWANFFLVLNKEGCVSVVHASRYDRQWGVDLDPLVDGGLWSAEGRFFSRNKTL